MASVKKRKWTYKGADKSAWVVRWQEGGKHRSKQFEKKKDADAHRVKVENLEASGAGIIDSTITVKEVCKKFLENEELRVRDGRIVKSNFINTRTAVNKYIDPLIGHHVMVDLQPSQVDWLYGEMLKKGLSPRTSVARVQMLAHICEFAVKYGFARDNVARKAKKGLRGIPPARVKTFTQTEMQTLLSALESPIPGVTRRGWQGVRCFVHFAAFCGLRAGEIRALQVDCLDFENRIVHVRHNLTRQGELKSPKTRAGVRDVPLPAHIAEMVGDWLQRYQEPNALDLIFCASNGRQYDHVTLDRQWAKVQKAADLLVEGDKFHFHALRHFAASWMLANGLPLTDIAQILGHSKFDMTLQVYAHSISSPNQRRIAIDGMSDRLLTQTTEASCARGAQNSVTY